VSRIASTWDGRGPALDALVADWAAGDPAIKRVWLYGATEEDEAGRPVDLALQLQPVADSEETIAVWMGKCEKWRQQLASRTGREVMLEWLDADEGARATRAGEAAMLVYERAG
jgi:hypothetical protein